MNIEVSKEDAKVLISHYKDKLNSVQQQAQYIMKKLQILEQAASENESVSIKAVFSNLTDEVNFNPRRFCLNLIQSSGKLLVLQDFIDEAKKNGQTDTSEFRKLVSNTLASLKFAKKINNYAVTGEKEKYWGSIEWFKDGIPFDEYLMEIK